MNPKVDWFFDKAANWQKEYEQLRIICLDCGFERSIHGRLDDYLIARAQQGAHQQDQRGHNSRRGNDP